MLTFKIDPDAAEHGTRAYVGEGRYGKYYVCPFTSDEGTFWSLTVWSSNEGPNRSWSVEDPQEAFTIARDYDQV